MHVQADLTGKLGLDEFKLLWADLRLYRAVFKRYDADNSGRFNTHEMACPNSQLSIVDAIDAD